LDDDLPEEVVTAFTTMNESPENSPGANAPDGVIAA
jgi:hypothetical protein